MTLVLLNLFSFFCKNYSYEKHKYDFYNNFFHLFDWLYTKRIDLGELSGLFMGCMGKEIVFTTLKQFLRKTLPPAISLTIIIMEFAQCMSNK